VILRAIRDHLVATATPEELARSKAAITGRKEEQANWRRRECEKDAALTDRRCPECGLPCPTYRKTCKFCGLALGREEP